MAILLKNFEESDIKDIDRIFLKRGDLGVPSLRNVLVNSTLIKSNEIIGYGVVKLYAEAVLILDPEIRKRDKAKAVRLGLNLAIDACKSNGVEQLFVFSTLDSYSEVLKKKFNFKEVPGKTLFLEFEDHQKEGN